MQFVSTSRSVPSSATPGASSGQCLSSASPSTPSSLSLQRSVLYHHASLLKTSFPITHKHNNKNYFTQSHTKHRFIRSALPDSSSAGLLFSSTSNGGRTVHSTISATLTTASRRYASARRARSLEEEEEEEEREERRRLKELKKQEKEAEEQKLLDGHPSLSKLNTTHKAAFRHIIELQSKVKAIKEAKLKKKQSLQIHPDPLVNLAYLELAEEEQIERDEEEKRQRLAAKGINYTTPGQRYDQEREERSRKYQLYLSGEPVSWGDEEEAEEEEDDSHDNHHRLNGSHPHLNGSHPHLNGSHPHLNGSHPPGLNGTNGSHRHLNGSLNGTKGATHGLNGTNGSHGHGLNGYSSRLMPSAIPDPAQPAEPPKIALRNSPPQPPASQNAKPVNVFAAELLAMFDQTTKKRTAHDPNKPKPIIENPFLKKK